MILLDKPYISDFLKQYLLEAQVPIIHTNEAVSMLDDEAYHFISETDAVDMISRNHHQALYTNTENSIAWVEANLPQSEPLRNIHIFKDKHGLRELLRPLSLNYFYTKVPMDALETVDFTSFSFPLIIKPNIGFFSMGIARVDSPDDWLKAVQGIKQELQLSDGLYPKTVFDAQEFVVEEYIDGDEYAVDCYFDDNGKVVVLNILSHLFADKNDVSDRVYITSKAIMKSLLTPVEKYLNQLGNMAKLKNFPLHLEFRRKSTGEIIHIEGNPMRFGGWCTTPDLAWYSFGLNLYAYYFEKKRPDWNSIFETMDDNIYSMILLNNSSGIEGRRIDSFDYSSLMQRFEKPLVLRKTNFRDYPLFGFLFCKTRPQNMGELYSILRSSLSEFITAKI